MKLRNTVIVLALCALVGGYALINAYWSKPAGQPTALDVKADDITKLDLQYPDHAIELVRGASGKWRLAKPIEADATPAVANAMAGSMADCRVTRTVEEKPHDLALFGLDKPKVIVTVTAKGRGQLPSLEVGRRTPIGFSTYIKMSDKPAVMLASGDLAASVTRTVNDLRSRELMHFRLADVTRFTIERGGSPPVEVARVAAQWRIVKPAAHPADSAVVDAVLDSLSNARVVDFVNDHPPDLAPYGLKEPALKLAVYTGSKTRAQTLFFGANPRQGNTNAYYVERGDDPAVYTVARSVFTSADKSASDLRDKTLLALGLERVGQVTIAGASQEFSLKRAPKDTWEVVEGGKSSPADTIKVETFLDDLRTLKGVSIVEEPASDLKRYGLDAPTVTITVTGKDGKEIGAIKIARGEAGTQSGAEAGKEAGKTTGEAKFIAYATSTSGDLIYAINRTSYDEMSADAGHFRSPAPTPAPKSGSTPTAPPKT